MAFFSCRCIIPARLSQSILRSEMSKLFIDAFFNVGAAAIGSYRCKPQSSFCIKRELDG